MEVLLSIIVTSAAYLLGSVSWAVVVGRLARGIDMTEVGDARLGAAFSIRKLGLGWGITVGGLDLMKGVIAAALPLALGLHVAAMFLAGLAVVAGHNWSVFLRFKGGRGAATSFGVLTVGALVPLLIGGVALAFPYYLTRRRMFIRGLRRTTLVFGAWMILIALLLWADLQAGFLPQAPWAAQASLWSVALPPCLLMLNILKRP